MIFSGRIRRNLRGNPEPEQGFMYPLQLLHIFGDLSVRRQVQTPNDVVLY